jgi:L-ornithine N5-oxygenase
VHHYTRYLPEVERLIAQTPNCRVAVVGGSQAAAELLLHIAKSHRHAMVVGISRTFGYRMKDVSPFTGEVYFPEFVDLFFHADAAMKRRLRGDLHHTNYSATDLDVLDALYRECYQQKLLGEQRLHFLRSADIESAAETADGVTIALRRAEQPTTELRRFDVVVLATGFRDIGAEEPHEPYHPLLEGLRRQLVFERGCMHVDADYRLSLRGLHPDAPCFVNGLCESSHGMGDAGSFSLLALRSQVILDSLVRHAEYRRTRRAQGGAAQFALDVPPTAEQVTP